MVIKGHIIPFNFTHETHSDEIMTLDGIRTIAAKYVSLTETEGTANMF